MIPSLNIYLINLDRATGRLARMAEVLAAAGLNYERVPAVDGEGLNFPHPHFHARAYRFLHGRRCIPAEVGCYLSHVECARRLLASNAEHALILEDDLAFSVDFTAVLADALHRTDDWDILRLSTMNSGLKMPYLELGGGRKLAIAIGREKGAGAYVINRTAAEWITRKLLPMRLSYDIAFDLEYLDGLRASFVTPVPVSQREEKVSQIQSHVRAAKYPRSRYLSVLPFRAWLELSRVTMRFLRCWKLRFIHDAKHAALAATPTLIALALAVDEVIDNM